MSWKEQKKKKRKKEEDSLISSEDRKRKWNQNGSGRRMGEEEGRTSSWNNNKPKKREFEPYTYKDRLLFLFYIDPLKMCKGPYLSLSIDHDAKKEISLSLSASNRDIAHSSYLNKVTQEEKYFFSSLIIKVTPRLAKK